MARRAGSLLPHRSTPRARRGRRRRRGLLRRLFSGLWPSAARRRRWWRAFRRTPATVQAVLGITLLGTLWFGANGVYQVVRKPSEIFFPVSGTLHKTPSQTWSAYSPIFRRHATEVIRPELLAALAQVEAMGNPVARTYWRWKWTPNPFEVYRPASSAVGMYQIIDATFERASRYCIHDHVVVEEGPWNDWSTCWLNELYFRVVPSHSVELTSAFLDRAVSDTLSRHRIRNATRAQKQRLAALIHLCGTGAGDRYAERGLALESGARCGDHDPRGYLARVDEMTSTFARLAARER